LSDCTTEKSSKFTTKWGKLSTKPQIYVQLTKETAEEQAIFKAHKVKEMSIAIGHLEDSETIDPITPFL